MRFGVLEMDPAHNPAVLDTATWDPAGAAQRVIRSDAAYWERVRDAAANDLPLPSGAGLVPHTASCSRLCGRLLFLVSLDDGQQVFVELGSDEPLLGQPLISRPLAPGVYLAAHAADAPTVHRFVTASGRSPRPLGPIPRLGVGTRMTTAVWPAIYNAMADGGFAANAIQNSVREVNLLADLLAGAAPESNYAFSFGSIESGYTGSSFEGLWVAGTLEGLKHPAALRFGADADHIQVKRGPGGLARAKQVIEAARHYTFFTLDISDILDYGALSADDGQARAYLEAHLSDAAQRAEVLAYHASSPGAGATDMELDAAAVGRLVGKYWLALDAVEELAETVQKVREGGAFDLELSMDEHPPEISTSECLTSALELRFVLAEAARRGVALTHVAPNFGVEKGTDYRLPDGLVGLERRMRALQVVADAWGVLLDVHSGDDLSAAARGAIRRATDGRLHFKVSPMLQLLFGQVLEEHHPALFRRWWDDALAYARCEAEGGSPLASACLREAEARGWTPSAHDSVFHHYGFRYVGRRDAHGQFPQREEFYSLSEGFYRAYQERVERYLGTLAAELF